MITVALGSDHGGVALKAILTHFLKQQGYSVQDYGTFDETSVDYPEFAQKVCQAIVQKQADYGILMCKSGIGMSIAANKFRHIRAALVYQVAEARSSRAHNNANVLCLGSQSVSAQLACEITDAFLKTHFEGNRHQARVDQIERLSQY